MEDCEAILEYVYEACREEAALWFSYHFTPIFESPTSKNTFIWARDYPFELQKKYFAEGYRELDPVPQLTLDHGYVLTWRRAMELGASDSDARKYFEVFREYEIENWAGFALYGPRNRDAFAGLTFRDDPECFDEGRLTHLHTMLQTAHLRICQIIEGAQPDVSLSERERQVLVWMGRGKSAGEIGKILDISSETVKTYTKRLYDKLDTNDRVTATVRALKLGLVEL
nr:LuxR family transcriptional regulator [Qipengyuania sphaerica]